ncbi:hypothetical protein EVAR_99658_1 [Eumeta japonica]|uniref:Uncharacterized protein n=1 Tax=Eumeta variegata TaxID=151549 RepID=A0A4C1ZKA1_EUMVA|nr:hypothetical protein EVAR_99658_1 [Eumeta japonica]
MHSNGENMTMTLACARFVYSMPSSRRRSRNLADSPIPWVSQMEDANNRSSCKHALKRKNFTATRQREKQIGRHRRMISMSPLK